MEPQFEELAERISRDVADRVTETVSDRVAETVTARVTENVTARVTETVTARVTENLTRDLGAALSKRISTELDAAEQRLSHQAQMNFEAVKEQARLAAEGYAATLDGINRRLEDIEQAVTIRLHDHDGILANHHSRITALERKN